VRWFAWGMFGAYAALVGGTIWLAARGGEVDEGLSGLLVGYAVVGALIASRHRRNLVGWLLLAIALTFGLQSLGEAYVMGDPNPGREWVGWVGGWVWYVWIALTCVFLPLLFPDGRLLSRRWRPVAWLGAVALALTIVSTALKPGDLDLSAPVDNPLGVHGVAEDLAAAAGVLGNGLVAVAFLLAGASLLVRFRRARGTERLQLKWFVLVALLAIVALTMAMAEVLFPGGWRRPIGTVGWFTFLGLVVIGIPAATGIAILRHRLYDIDVVINRTLVYAGLTATLAGAYLGTVLLLQLVLSPVTRDSGLAIAASTLAVAALFRPARARIQAAVDRRFYRSRYDAALTLQAFSGRLREQVDLEALGSDLRAVIDETMQPAHSSLWLRSPR
jgi:hypothetical protein